MSNSRPKLAPGRYRHYKGHDYEVIDLARHSESEAWHVIYRPLYTDSGLWIRPLEMFTEMVEHQGESQPRFRYLEPMTTSN